MKVYRKRLFCSLYVMLLFSSSLWSQSLVSIKSVKEVNEKAKEKAAEEARRNSSPNLRQDQIALVVLEAKKKVVQKKAIYSVLLGGELRDISKKQEGDSKSFSNASFGISYSGIRWSLSLMVKVADSQGPIQSAYGQALLNPAGLEQAAGYVDVAYNINEANNLYLRGYFTTATNDWQTIVSGTDEAVSAQATIINIGAGAYKRIWDVDLKEASSKITSNVFVGLTSRFISGDLGFPEKVTLREAMLGRSGRGYIGGELYWDIFFNGIKGFADLTYFAHHIPGFSRFRITAGIGLQFDIVSFEK